MKNVEVSEAEVEAVRSGHSKFFPLVGGGTAMLSYRDGVYRLRPFADGVIIRSGHDPGEGAVLETPPA